MAEIMEKEVQSPESEAAAEKVSLRQKWKAMPKKKKRRIRNGIIAAVVVAGLGFGGWKLMNSGEGEGEMEVVTDTVHYGSITSMVEGYGLTKAKTSESITLATGGIVREVYVTEGQKVT